MRKAFSLIAAVFLVIMLATISTVALSMATMSVGNTNSSFAREQAQFLAQSATEFTKLAMQVHNYDENCLQEVHINYPNDKNPLFTADVNIYYLDKNMKNNKPTSTKPNSDCDDNHIIGDSGVSGDPRKTVSAFIDVVVKQSKDTAIATPIVFNRRTLQIVKENSIDNSSPTP